MKKSYVLSILAALFLAAVLALAACETFEGEDGFVAVTNITVIPTTVTVGETKTLEATVLPANATNKTILWSVNGTEATLNPSNNNITGIKAGKVTLTATIINGKDNGKTKYTQELDITITNVFVPVESIIGIPATGTVGELTLNGTVIPAIATKQEITWSVVGTGTGAYFDGNKFYTYTAGNYNVLATITGGIATGNFTKTFPITISDEFMPVSSITGIPPAGVVGELLLSGIVVPSTATNKTITWSVVDAGGTSAYFEGNKLITTIAGNVKVKATITNGRAIGQSYTENFDINITAKFVAVTGINVTPTKGTVGVPLTLVGNVTPSNATNQAIRWVKEPAGTVNYDLDVNVFTAKQAGTVKVLAIIDNGEDEGKKPFTKDFTITISAFVPVTKIDNVPATGITYKSIDLSKAKVMPEDATNRNNITWEITNKGTTNAGSINSNNTFTATNKGTVTVTATIKKADGTNEYTEPFTIDILSEVEDIIRELGASAWAYEDRGKLILPNGGPYHVEKDITIPDNIEVYVTGEDVTLIIDSDKKITFKNKFVISGDSTFKVIGGGTLNLEGYSTVNRPGKLDINNVTVNINKVDVQGELSIGDNGIMSVLEGGILTISNGPEDEKDSWDAENDNKGKISGSGIIVVQDGGTMRVPDPVSNSKFFSLSEINRAKVLIYAGGDFHLLGYNKSPDPDFPNVEWPLIGEDIGDIGKTWRGAEYEVSNGFIEMTFNNGTPALTLKGKANALGVRKYTGATYTREEMKLQLVLTIDAKSVLTIGKSNANTEKTTLSVTAYGTLINNGIIYINDYSKLQQDIENGNEDTVKGTVTIFNSANVDIKPDNTELEKRTWYGRYAKTP